MWNPLRRRREERARRQAAYETALAERDGFERAYLAVSAERDEARAEAARLQAERDGFERAWRAVSVERATVQAQLDAHLLPARHLPSLLMITMPKSGTVFCQAALRQTFGLRDHSVCGGGFPVDRLDQVGLATLARGGQVAMSHADASSANLAALAAYGQPFVLHLRDPRAAMLSMLHHIRAYHADPALRPFLVRIGVTFPADFHGAPFPVQLDAMIAWYLPAVVAWTEAWLAALEADAALARQALLTRYEALGADSAAFLRDVCAHVGLPAADVSFAEPPRDASAHFRKGDDGEWRGVLSPPQRDAATAALPTALRARFGWA